MTPQVQPLSHRHRNFFFYILAAAFFISLPFLVLYATGYRFSLLQTSWISTGGLYVAADRTGAEIYIDDELVRETRVFRRAFYAQGLNAGTHKVHVQKDGHHTWVKELPVYPHLVTEAQAFNLPHAPQVRLITKWQTGSGVAILTATSSVLTTSTGINQYLFEPRAATSTLVANPEYTSLLEKLLPATTSATSSATSPTGLARVILNTDPSDTGEAPTTTKEWRGVRLYEEEESVYAAYIGPQNQMPYYYCAEPFPRYDPATTTMNSAVANIAAADIARAAFDPEEELLFEVKSVSPDIPCDPVIEMELGGEKVKDFDFFPGSTDLVILAQESGIYVVEIDDRAWQNRQPLLLGEDLSLVIQNNAVYAFDGKNFYQVVINQNWF